MIFLRIILDELRVYGYYMLTSIYEIVLINTLLILEVRIEELSTKFNTFIDRFPSTT